MLQQEFTMNSQQKHESLPYMVSNSKYFVAIMMIHPSRDAWIDESFAAIPYYSLRKFTFEPRYMVMCQRPRKLCGTQVCYLQELLIRRFQPFISL